MNSKIEHVDHSALRFNQAMIITVLLGAFILNMAVLVGLVALVMLVGTFIGQPGFGVIYTRWLKPRGWVKPDILEDNPQPHRFAQGLGGAMLLGASVALMAGNVILGWVLVWMVIALAALNLFVGFCAGCFVYYWLSRLRVPGFVAQPKTGALPGMRPSRKVR